MSNKDKGYVYILTNPSFKEDWVKIGKSKREPDVRSKELFNTAVPLPYEVYGVLKSEKYDKAEKLIHRSIDRISDLRINKSREFFNISPSKAYEILYDIKELLGEEATLELYGDNVIVKNPTKERTKRKKDTKPFTFSSVDIKVGETLEFIGDPSIKVVVIDDKHVLFESNSYSLSGLTRKLYTRMKKANKSGAYQGPAFFKYKNKKLTDIQKK